MPSVPLEIIPELRVVFSIYIYHMHIEMIEAYTDAHTGSCTSALIILLLHACTRMYAHARMHGRTHKQITRTHTHYTAVQIHISLVLKHAMQ